MLMVGFCVLAPLGDGTAKILGERLPVVQILTVRFVTQWMLLLPIIYFAAISLKMSRRGLTLTALRTVLHIIGIGAMFMSLKFLPLADAIAIAFVMPFIMLLLGKFALGEEVGQRRIIACVIGFIGTLLVVQPSFAAVGAPALLPLLVAVVFALFMLVTRQIAKETDPIGLQAVSGLMASVVLIPLLFVFEGSEIAELDPVAPLRTDWILLVLLGTIGTVAHLLMTWSLRFAPFRNPGPGAIPRNPLCHDHRLAVFPGLAKWPRGFGHRYQHRRWALYCGPRGPAQPVSAAITNGRAAFGIITKAPGLSNFN